MHVTAAPRSAPRLRSSERPIRRINRPDVAEIIKFGSDVRPGDEVYTRTAPRPTGRPGVGRTARHRRRPAPGIVLRPGYIMEREQSTSAKRTAFANHGPRRTGVVAHLTAPSENGIRTAAAARTGRQQLATTTDARKTARGQVAARCERTSTRGGVYPTHTHMANRSKPLVLPVIIIIIIMHYPQHGERCAPILFRNFDFSVFRVGGRESILKKSRVARTNAAVLFGIRRRRRTQWSGGGGFEGQLIPRFVLFFSTSGGQIVFSENSKRQQCCP